MRNESTPSRCRALVSAPETSARPPVLAKGTASDERMATRTVEVSVDDRLFRFCLKLLLQENSIRYVLLAIGLLHSKQQFCRGKRDGYIFDKARLDLTFGLVVCDSTGRHHKVDDYFVPDSYAIVLIEGVFFHLTDCF